MTAALASQTPIDPAARGIVKTVLQARTDCHVLGNTSMATIQAGRETKETGVTPRTLHGLLRSWLPLMLRPANSVAEVLPPAMPAAIIVIDAVESTTNRSLNRLTTPPFLRLQTRASVTIPPSYRSSSSLRSTDSSGSSTCRYSGSHSLHSSPNITLLSRKTRSVLHQHSAQLEDQQRATG